MLRTTLLACKIFVLLRLNFKFLPTLSQKFVTCSSRAFKIRSCVHFRALKRVDQCRDFIALYHLKLLKHSDLYSFEAIKMTLQA